MLLGVLFSLCEIDLNGIEIKILIHILKNLTYYSIIIFKKTVFDSVLIFYFNYRTILYTELLFFILFIYFYFLFFCYFIIIFSLVLSREKRYSDFGIYILVQAFFFFRQKLIISIWTAQMLFISPELCRSVAF